MLIALLFLATSLCPLQDGQTPPAPPAGAPATAAPGQDAAPAAPAPTSEKVRSYLMEAESHLYDPQAAGLKTLSFDLPFEVPQLGNLGTVHVKWSADGTPDIHVEHAEGVQLPQGLRPEMIDQRGEQAGEQLLQTMLNRPISPMLDSYTATMEGAQDGLVKVSFSSPESTAQGLKEQAYFFDDESHLQKVAIVMEQMGMTIKQTESFAWKPATGTDRLILDTQNSEAETPMGKMTSKTTFGYRTVDQLMLVTQMSMASEAPPMLGGKSTQVMTAKNLVVNGKAIPDEAPPAAPAEPAAPAPSSGG